MAVKSYKRGWKIIWRDNLWAYADTGEAADYERPCRRCGKMPTPEGYDACLGKILGATSACCGHGIKPPIVIYNQQEVVSRNALRREER